MKSIGRKLILQVTLIISVTVAGLSAVEVYTRHKEFTALLDVKSARIMQQLSIVLGPPLWEMNWDQIDGILRSYLDDSDILAIKVSELGNVVSYFGKTPHSFELVNLIQDPSQIFQYTDAFMQQARIASSTDVVGMCEVTFSRQTVMSQMQKAIVNAVVFFALLCSLLIFSISSVMSTSVSRPVKGLMRVFENVAGGDFDQPIDTSRSDEIGSLAKSFASLRDEIKEKIRALRELNGELDLRVAKRTAQLEATNKELEAFAYSVSHDLRSPLRAIDGFSLALLEDYLDALDEEGQDYLQRVRAASQRMGGMIDDLLKLSRLTRGDMRYESVDLSVLAQSIAEAYQSREPERNVELLITPDLVAQGDSQLVRIALENLLGNAWKFTAQREQARICFGAEDVDGHVSFFVRDNGAGFDMNYADKLFGAFQRLHGAKEFPGTGIGLATVQRVINRHGGRIWAEGVVEQGATFYFTLATDTAQKHA